MKNVIEIYKESGRPMIRKSNNEYAGACPSCGGHDRLIMWQTSRDPRQHYGNFYCRQCGIGGGAEKLLQLLRNSTSIIQQKKHSAHRRCDAGHSKVLFPYLMKLLIEASLLLFKELSIN